jgi:hypothetical protein
MGGKTQSEHMYSEVPHIADIRKAAPSVPGLTYGPRTPPVAEGRGTPARCLVTTTRVAASVRIADAVFNSDGKRVNLPRRATSL